MIIQDKKYWMKLFLASIFILIVVPSVNSVNMGANTGEGVVMIRATPPTNFSVQNVNGSDFWDNLNNPADISVLDLSDFMTELANNRSKDVDFGSNVGIGFTAGSVVFSNGSNLAEDNANFFWDNTNKRLGIGTASPDRKLHVYANDVGDGQLRLEQEGTGDSAIAFELTGLQGWSVGIDQTDSAFKISSSSNAVSTNTKFTILNGGNVGIGTANPDGNLHVMSGSAGSVTASTSANELVVEGTTNVGISILSNTDSVTQIVFGDASDNDKGILRYSHVSDKMGFWTATTQRMIIDGSGKVGIGNTNPGSILDISGGTTKDQLRITEDSTQTNYYKIGRSTADGLLYFQGTQAGYTGYSFLNDDGTSVLTMLDNKNVGIGTSSPDAKLHVKSGDAGAISVPTGADEFLIEHSTTGGMSIYTPDANNARINFGSATDDSVAFIDASYSAGTTRRMRFDVNGKSIVFQDDNFNLTTSKLYVEGGATFYASSSILADGLTLDLGTGANVDQYIRFAGARGFVGYSGGGNTILQGGASKGIRLQVNSGTFDAGTDALVIDLNANSYFKKDVVIQDDLNVTGNITGNSIYGEMWFHQDTTSVTTAIAISGVYYNLTGFNGTGASANGTSLNGFTFNADKEHLTTKVAGKYKVDYAISFGNVGNNQEYQTIIFINQVAQNNTDTHRKIGASGDVGNTGTSGFIDLNVNDNVTLRIRNNDGVSDVLVHAGNLNLVRIGS